MFVFWEIWRALLFCSTRFEIRPFALLPANYRFHKQNIRQNQPQNKENQRKI